MKKLIAMTIMASVATGSALAGTPAAVPEMDAGVGIAAIALLAGAVAIVREKITRK